MTYRETASTMKTTGSAQLWQEESSILSGELLIKEQPRDFQQSTVTYA